MALDAYQEIFCRMTASTDYRSRLLDDPDSLFGIYDLTACEQRRLLAMARHPGMHVNTAIHRANRLTPLDQTLPFTCVLLGDRLGPILDCYWAMHPTENLQLPAECARFADFLEMELAAKRVIDPYLEEVLAFERSCTELRFFTEDELKSSLAKSETIPARIRIVRFRHNPEQLLEALLKLESPPLLEEGDYYLAIDARSGNPVFRMLDPKAVASLTGQ